MHILQKYDIYMQNMKLLTLTIQQGTLYTHLIYITEQIWLSLSNYSSQPTYYIGTYNKHFCMYVPKLCINITCINMLCMYLYLYLRLYLYIYCILIIFHVTSYVVVWMITLRQLLIFSYFILLKWLHDEVHMMMKWSEWIRWGELIKSAYIQLKQLEDTWAFLPSLSLQLIGYCVRLRLYVPKPGPWGVVHINKWGTRSEGQWSICMGKWVSRLVEQ